MDNLAKYLKPRAKFTKQLGGVAISFVGIALFLLFATLQQNEEMKLSSLRLEQLRVSQLPQVAPKMSRAQLEDQKRWDALIAERSFSWKSLFLAIERVGNPNIELLEFHPDKTSRHVILNGEARDHQALLKFLEMLTAQPMMKNVHLTHQEKTTREALNTVTFEIKATLNE
jgi:hypothetical protein